MKDTHNLLKKLQIKRNRLHEQLDREEGGDPKLRRELKAVNRQIKHLGEKANIVISEHALLRYLERVRGLDMEQLKKEILPQKTQKLIRTFRNCGMTVTNGVGTYQVKVRNGVVTTVFDKEEVAS